MNNTQPGEYIFAYYHYDDTLTPQLALHQGTSLHHIPLHEQTFTLSFDTTQRFCTGWHDLATQTSYPCPDKAPVDDAYSECRSCQQKTGFNPAFYYSDTISPQQHARNQEPHMLYLAHFTPGVIKVGITYAKRDIRRLLDQGARSCLILKTFPTADIARQYEARIAALPDFLETLQSRQKKKYLRTSYDPKQAAEELYHARDIIHAETSLTPDDEAPRHLDTHYFATPQPTFAMLIDMNSEARISGAVVGMIGDTLITEQDDTHFMLSLGKLRGYPATLSDTVVPNRHTPQQASLF